MSLLGPPKAVSSKEAGISGVLSGVTTRALVSPLDVLKIRFQLQISDASRDCRKYRNLKSALRTILREEGLRAFWKGHSAAQLLSISYTSVQFVVFEYLANNFPTNFSKSFNSFVYGGIAATTATCLTMPLDTLRTRIVMQRDVKEYKNLLHAASRMLANEGIRSFWKGLLPNAVEKFPYAGTQFGTYSLLTTLYDRLFIEYYGEGGDYHLSSKFVCGGLAGTFSKVLFLPFDFTKKRLQVQGFNEVIKGGGLSQIPEYKGVLHCIITVYKTEGGVKAFYKGTAPSVLKAFFSTGLTFGTYNFYCNVLSQMKNSC